jgi:hypothetical protein
LKGFAEECNGKRGKFLQTFAAAFSGLKHPVAPCVRFLARSALMRLSPGLLPALCWVFACTSGVSAAYAQEPSGIAENIILITIDGLRWQEVFRGLDERLLIEEYNSVGDALNDKFGGATPEARATVLMPFLHQVLLDQGAMIGNRDASSCARVTNPWYFSYPGYNEILTGVPDPDIDTNDSILNPNVTLLEWLQHQQAYEGKVAAFTSWDAFPFIVNAERSGVPVNAGPKMNPETALEETLTRLHGDIPSPWPTVRLDAFTHHYALSHMQNHHPRVLYLAFGETDDFAHEGDYDQYLMAAHRTDRFISELWDFVQADVFYKDKTAIIITVDHGRGEEPLETWKHHASKESLKGYMKSLAQYEEGIVGSDAVWIAAIGAGVAHRGLVKNTACAGSNQIAATLLTLLGIDYRDFDAAAAAPLEDILVTP